MKDDGKYFFFVFKIGIGKKGSRIGQAATDANVLTSGGRGQAFSPILMGPHPLVPADARPFLGAPFKISAFFDGILSSLTYLEK